MKACFRAMCCLLTVILLSALFSASASAADPDIVETEAFIAEAPDLFVRDDAVFFASGKSGDWQYETINGTVQLRKYLGSDTSVTVPATLNGLPVTTLYYCFFENQNVVSVTLPESVKELDAAFYGCSALKSVTGGRITTLGEWSFGRCPVLETIPSFREGLTAIPSYCFYGCRALKTINIPSTVSSFGSQAFSGCSAWEKPVMPASLREIGSWCFYNCGQISEMGLPAGVKTIEEYAFYNCNALTKLTLCSGLTSIGANAFNWCQNLTSLDVPDTVTQIGQEAFWSGTRLIVGEGSAAQTYAEQNDIPYQIRGGVDLTEEIHPNDMNIYTKAQAIVETLTNAGMSDYDKALILHDYLILHASYDQSYSRYTAADILLYHSGVCQAYTEAYELLLRFAGISCDREYGDDHIWNMALLDGEWVHIDCTWDDPITADGRGAERHDFFGITNYALEGVRSHECFNKPRISTSVKRSYAYVNGTLASHIAQVEAELQDSLDRDELHGSADQALYHEYDTQKAGILNRMLMQGAALDGLRWHGYPVAFETDFAPLAGRLNFDACVSVPAKKTMVLPKALTKLEAGSLNGTAAHRFVLPAELKSIGAGAFPDDFFVIEAPEGSYALEYAQNAGLPWQFSPKA